MTKKDRPKDKTQTTAHSATDRLQARQSARRDRIDVEARRLTVLEGIEKFWTFRKDTALAPIATAIFQAATKEDVDLFLNYGPGLWVDVCSKLALLCNFWLTVGRKRLETVAEIDGRWEKDPERFSRLQDLLTEKLSCYPWNRRWLIPGEAPDGDLQELFAETLLREGLPTDASNLGIAEARSGTEPCAEKKPLELTIEHIIKVMYGSLENARHHVFESYLRGMGYIDHLDKLIRAEEDEIPFSKSDIPTEPASPEGIAHIVNWVQTYINTINDSTSKHFEIFLKEFPWMIKGPVAPTLWDHLNRLSHDALLMTADRHHLPLKHPEDRYHVIDELVRALPRHFIRDLMYLDEDQVFFFTELTDSDGILMNASEAIYHARYAIDGYLFAYPRHGGIRYFFPEELVSAMKDFDRIDYQINYPHQRKLWVLLTTMANFYGVYSIEQVKEAVKKFMPEDYKDLADEALTKKLIGEVEILAKNDLIFNYIHPFIYHSSLTYDQAKELWTYAEDTGVAFKPLTMDLISIYGDKTFDPNNRLFDVLYDAVFKMVQEKSGTEEELSHSIRQITQAVPAEVAPEDILKRLNGIPSGHRDPLIRAIGDYSNIASHWSVRGHTPQELNIDLRHLGH